MHQWHISQSQSYQCCGSYASTARRNTCGTVFCFFKQCNCTYSLIAAWHLQILLFIIHDFRNISINLKHISVSQLSYLQGHPFTRALCVSTPLKVKLAAKYVVIHLLHMHICVQCSLWWKETTKAAAGLNYTSNMWHGKRCTASCSRTLGTATKARSLQLSMGRLLPRQLQHNGACHVHRVGRWRGTSAHLGRKRSPHFGDTFCNDVIVPTIFENYRGGRKN